MAALVPFYTPSSKRALVGILFVQRDHRDVPVVLQHSKPHLFRPGTTSRPKRCFQFMVGHLHFPHGSVVDLPIVNDDYRSAFDQSLQTLLR